MSSIKQIFLDLDGPFLDGKDRHYFCYQTILKKYGFEPIGIEEYWEKKRSLLNRSHLLSFSSAETIYEEFLVEWLAMIESPEALALDKVQDGAIECLQNWKAAGFVLTLITMRKNKQGLEAQLDSTGLATYFDYVFVCEHAEGGEGKANIARSLILDGYSIDNVVWIGDTEADSAAAKSLGCKVFLVANGLRSWEYLKSLGADLIIPSISALNLVELDKLNVS